MLRPRPSLLVRSTLLVALCCAPLLAAADDAPATPDARLLVTLQRVSAAPGNLRVALYREAQTFRQEEHAFKVISAPAVAGDVKLSFDHLPAGRYAIVAYHDEDADGKLKLRLGMFPIEGYGLSNNPSVIGPPRFADSAFDVAAPETSVSIKLSY
jgi:uncharacterized protein (DUF2141 family)